MVLTVLKIIGIIILVIICLFILIFAMVLFLPIRYQFSGSYEEKLDGEAKIKWLPLILNASVSYHNHQLQYIVKIFGLVVMTNTEQKISWLGRKFFNFDEKEVVDEKVFKKNNGKQKEDINIALNDNLVKHQEDKIEQVRKNLNKEKTKNKVSLYKKIYDKIQKFKIKWKEFLAKFKEINKKKEALLKVYQSKRFEVAKKDAIIYIKKLWMIVKPKYLKGNIHFGLESPDTTGYVLGVVAMGIPLYQEYLVIQPDFSQKCLDGKLEGKGKIYCFFLLKLIIKVIMNKNLIKVTKKVQTIIEA